MLAFVMCKKRHLFLLNKLRFVMLKTNIGYEGFIKHQNNNKAFDTIFCLVKSSLVVFLPRLKKQYL